MFHTLECCASITYLPLCGWIKEAARGYCIAGKFGKFVKSLAIRQTKPSKSVVIIITLWLNLLIRQTFPRQILNLLLRGMVHWKPTMQSFSVTLSLMCTSEQIMEFCMVQLHMKFLHEIFGLYTWYQRDF